MSTRKRVAISDHPRHRGSCRHSTRRPAEISFGWYNATLAAVRQSNPAGVNRTLTRFIRPLRRQTRAALRKGERAASGWRMRSIHEYTRPPPNPNRFGMTCFLPKRAFSGASFRPAFWSRRNCKMSAGRSEITSNECALWPSRSVGNSVDHSTPFHALPSHLRLNREASHGRCRLDAKSNGNYPGIPEARR